MYLKSLTLRGFKSFASATTLNFEPGVTCVVGPNGSGKSNVVDALSWVMGEQGVKSLRGGKMEDVIFAGTAGRPALGRAEVSLTIDNTDGALPIEYTEVTISRTMFRSGGSEYAINGNPARLLDVQELLSDSGIGREMHVIVGQGQLDTILQASPEQRRGFIEEAAGVLKHRRRKEKAVRKLESTTANLNRLKDLIAEIRRQLKPLGRQAEVARKAAWIQAELRDARARLLSDDLTAATLALESDLADERLQAEAKSRVEAELEAARAAEAAAEAEVADVAGRLSVVQETWYQLSALRERAHSTTSIAAERIRHGEAPSEVRASSRDPDALEAEASEAREEETSLQQVVAERETELSAATQHRADQEAKHAEAERDYSAQLRAQADRREGLARLNGQVNALNSRLEASAEEVERLTTRQTEAVTHADQAEAQFAELEARLAGLDAGESGLDEAWEQAQATVDELAARLAELRDQERVGGETRASLVARLEALEMGLDLHDAGAALVAARDHLNGILGEVASLVRIESGWEPALSAALGRQADGIAVSGLSAALDALAHLKQADLGRAEVMIAASPAPTQGAAPPGARWLADLIEADDSVRGAVRAAVTGMVAVEDLSAAAQALTQHPDLVAVTRSGDVVSQWSASGGSAAKPSRIEVQAAVDEARQRLASAEGDLDQVREQIADATQAHDRAEGQARVALERLHASDAELAALADQLGQLGQTARSARAEAERLEQTIGQARSRRSADETALAELTERLELAQSGDTEPGEIDSAARDELAAQARAARQSEMDARLALRTAEERVRALAGRADALVRAAATERQARAKAAARVEQLRREATVATAVHAGAQWLLERVEQAREQSARDRREVDEARLAAEARLGVARRQTRELATSLDGIVQGAHRDEMARIELRMRIESLTEKALNELGLDTEVLLSEYAPDQMIPVLLHADGTPVQPDDDEIPEPVPFVREEQEKRRRTAEKNLQVLGRVNPLALEEFDALQERHAFLAEQLEDLVRTRTDLYDIITEVDARVQEVFAAAYADVEAAFEQVFARLFPGGEGRLVLTDPNDWLNTGVDVEARPAGKKVKRLSLLSGGERSLVAVAFLVSLFIARPSPFYILDEVEAALDDTNLGRLLEIYQQLRENSQLVVITHQKRTMEIADVLYGVTMRGDGVSTVISQRLHED